MELPKKYQKLVARKLTPHFPDAVVIESTDMCHPREGEVCIRNRYVGINADDSHQTGGRWINENNPPPFDTGFEGVGYVAAVGKNVEQFKVGDTVGYIASKNNAYAEYSCTSADIVFHVPHIKPEYVALLISGLTAAIGLDKAGKISDGKTVLITAASGGTGHIAVQWAKVKGCHVIGTCSSDSKSKVLQGLGCDRVINYKKEALDEVLSKEYPDGVDVIWETIGGKNLELCIKHLAEKGCLVIAGGISGYQKKKKIDSIPRVNLESLPSKLLFSSSCLQGFNMMLFEDEYPQYMSALLEMVNAGKIKIVYVIENENKKFIGMQGIIDAVQFQLSCKHVGKIVVEIP